MHADISYFFFRNSFSFAKRKINKSIYSLDNIIGFRFSFSTLSVIGRDCVDFRTEYHDMTQPAVVIRSIIVLKKKKKKIDSEMSSDFKF